MRSVDIGNSDCKRAEALLDAYLSNELTVETTVQISCHVERCWRCWKELRVREQIRRRLQLTRSHGEVPPELRRRISRMLRGASGLRISHLLV